MHTAHQLDVSMFDVEVDGRSASRESILPEWTTHDRLGVVVHEPLAALGASLLIQLAVTAFYDKRPERRETHPQYPEIYVFHVGGRRGDHRAFDFWPPRKEVFVDDDPSAVLGALNDRAITRLLVPEREATKFVPDYWADLNSLEERLVTSFAYSATGRVTRPDVRIVSRDPVLETNAQRALDPHGRLTWARSVADPELEESMPGPTPAPEAHRWAASLAARVDEVPAGFLERAAARRNEVVVEGLATETYRRLRTAEALGLLVPDPEATRRPAT